MTKITSPQMLGGIKAAYERRQAAYERRVLVCGGAGCVSCHCQEVREALEQAVDELGLITLAGKERIALVAPRYATDVTGGSVISGVVTGVVSGAVSDGSVFGSSGVLAGADTLCSAVPEVVCCGSPSEQAASGASISMAVKNKSMRFGLFIGFICKDFPTFRLICFRRIAAPGTYALFRQFKRYGGQAARGDQV